MRVTRIHVSVTNGTLVHRWYITADIYADWYSFQSQRLSIVYLTQGWPVHEPDIIVSTPVALLNYLHAVDPERRRRSNFIRGVKYVVSYASLIFLYLNPLPLLISFSSLNDM